uniref:Histone deacetylase 11 n=1 Tax=Piliocolobus tephrosceles TaxID=591936 RepID=A0A8C9GV37_9PRIM
MLHTTQLYQHVPETRWPIVYSPRYNITFMGLEKLHPFDAGKWGKVINFLKVSAHGLPSNHASAQKDFLSKHNMMSLAQTLPGSPCCGPKSRLCPRGLVERQLITDGHREGEAWRSPFPKIQRVRR